ncbi:MAG: DUF2892 domain-containing protein [Candidatus Moranbacteria bacterium]|nr:DUF2892 domain-containing protein [Candidatus Moranbacteria bacterium]
MEKDLKKKKTYRIKTDYWYIERLVYFVGGLFVFVSALLGFLADERFIYFTIFVGFMFVNFSLTGYCPMAIIFDRIGVKRK